MDGSRKSVSKAFDSVYPMQRSVLAGVADARFFVHVIDPSSSMPHLIGCLACVESCDVTVG